MIKKTVIVLSVVLVIGGVLFSMGSFIKKDFSLFSYSNSFGGSDQFLEKEVQEFSNIEVNIKSGDIIIEEGDVFSVKYNISDKEKIQRLEVVDGTLYFVTEFDDLFGLSLNHGEVRITMPKGHNIGKLNLSSVDGDIKFSDRTIKNGILNSVSGDIILDNITSDSINCEGISGDITLRNSIITQVIGNTTSSDISVDGSFLDVTLKSVSGDCHITSDRIKKMQIETVSGDIKTVTPSASVRAKSFGEISYNGNEQGFNFSIDGIDASLDLLSTSGEISIKTK